MIFTDWNRREFLRSPAMAASLYAVPGRPDLRLGNVQIGIIISPYNYPEIPVRADQTLATLVELGISAVEIQDVRVEVYAGAPSEMREGYSGSRMQPNQTPEQRAQRRHRAAAELKEWRLSAPLDKYQALRQMYSDAGVAIYAVRLARVSPDYSDAEYNYFFRAAQALGANQITVELPVDADLIQRVGTFAEHYKIRMGYHNHMQVNERSWDAALAASEYNGINFDVGHYAAAVNASPVPFIRAHNDRITSLHLKDQKYRSNGGANVAWGNGDTPLREILQLMKAERYSFPAAIELEYPIPHESSASAEIARCLRFCRKSLQET